MLNLDADFKKAFPKLPFLLNDQQKEAIASVYESGNTLCIMPTGGGKSVIYWMSAVEMGGITIVISPLTALIAEQSQKIRDNGYEVFDFYSDSQSEILKRLIEFANGKYTPNFIFTSPEKVATDGLFEYCLKKRAKDIKLLAIDEVHCVSQWGLNFRPFYKRIPAFLDNIFGTDNWCRILAMTATLNPKELKDICESFKIDRKNICRSDNIIRNSIQLHVLQFTDEEEKRERFWNIIRMHQSEKILVYVYRKEGKNSVVELSENAREMGMNAAYFHGEMSSKERADLIKKYHDNDIKIMFATNAFGMGIDIPDIRVVIHFMIPESAEQFYQEVGRAARDKGAANAYLLYTNTNIRVKKTHFIAKSFPSAEKLREVLQKVGNHEGLRTLQYFDDEDIQKCLFYFEEYGIIDFCGKGFANLKPLESIKNAELQKAYDSTKTKEFCITVKRSELSPTRLANLVYESIVSGEAALGGKPLTKYLVLNQNATEISDDVMARIQADIEEKKEYKNLLLDYFVSILDRHPDNLHLHQEIALYLGMDKHKLGLIYETEKGHKVRSKSEVIISNLLYKENIPYEYEKKLPYGTEGKWIEPDFTIMLKNGKRIFWEHLGMLGVEKYDNRWLEKIDIYQSYFKADVLITTCESGVLTKQAEEEIEKIKLFLQNS